MPDGRFVVIGGWLFNDDYDTDTEYTSSCEGLSFDADGVPRWNELPPMHDARADFASGVIAWCAVGSNSAP
jgi:hypothetical protein